MLAGKREKFAFLEKAIGPAFSFLPANVWTLISIIFSIGTAYFLVMQQFLYAGTALFITGVLDMVDGAVARATKKAGPKGAYLDTVVDRYAEGIIAFGLLLSGFAFGAAFDIPSGISVDFHLLLRRFHDNLRQGGIRGKDRQEHRGRPCGEAGAACCFGSRDVSGSY